MENGSEEEKVVCTVSDFEAQKPPSTPRLGKKAGSQPLDADPSVTFRGRKTFNGPPTITDFLGFGKRPRYVLVRVASKGWLPPVMYGAREVARVGQFR